MMALLSGVARTEIEEVARKVEKVETAVEPRFQEHFVAAMAIPHKTATFPELSKAVDAAGPDRSSRAGSAWKAIAMSEMTDRFRALHSQRHLRDAQSLGSRNRPVPGIARDSPPWRRRVGDWPPASAASTRPSPGTRCWPTPRLWSAPSTCRSTSTPSGATPRTLPGVTETVRLLGDAGAAGCSIEDYDPATKSIDPIEKATERVAAAAEGAQESGLVLTARAENPFYGFDDLDDTIARLCSYRDAGAEVVYAPGLVDADEIARVVTETGVPVNVLGRSNGPSVNALAELGVRRISTGGAIARASFELLNRAARELLDQGTSTYSVGIFDRRRLQEGLRLDPSQSRRSGARKDAAAPRSTRVFTAPTTVDLGARRTARTSRTALPNCSMM